MENTLPDETERDEIQTKEKKIKNQKYYKIDSGARLDTMSMDISGKVSKPTKIMAILKWTTPVLLLVMFNILYIASQEGCPYDINENPVL